MLSSSSSQLPRSFSTAAKVHPSYLPEMHVRYARRRVPSRWFASVAAVMVAGYGIQTWAVRARDRRIAEAQAAESHDAERRRQQEALLEQYGGRDSLEALEKAVQFYERK
ncbi:hypothetical protein ACRE_064280 [Hapsidospora chrysogenum ATCC 11550]|uniref:Transmembrane protein n=1 Tax=Hapsidospora chrysogenum (strain ATCC 11550 / CBS 779.69 / DSM 880 / IAM 14645 / JCM 23072 / IMI 49137) TaxID=857340 RepID=A0A086T0F1_HAPC1|nr:hypothetical protein ACRE_064280 [Hapsidospora chrysogenum ATCC 11550]